METASIRKNTFSDRTLLKADRVRTAHHPRFSLHPLVAALAALGLAQPIYAQQLPQGPTVVNGSASVGTSGTQMTITNSPNAILNWQSFSIGAQNGVRFQQQHSASQVLNRVTGTDPSAILGTLSSNGRVWLINPHGVLFGQNARIDVAGMVASTLDIANADFLAGRYNFVAASGANRGEVMNKGEIRTTFGGRVWLLGEQVKNEGLVETPGGQIVLAAGKSIELIDSGMPNVVVRITAPENEAINLGALVAIGGSVDLHAGIVNQEGIVRATGLTTDANGRIVLKAMSDLILAEGSKSQAGNVNVTAGFTLNNRGEVSGNNITLSGNQVVQQGVVKAPGGTIILTAQSSIYLDGSVDASNPEGKGGNIKLTTGKLEGMAGGTLSADGKQGGKIQVEGRGMIAFSSTLSATGKDQGGTIEVTGDKVYLLNADVDASGGTQGGTVHLGGGWQGGGDLSHANEVLVGLGSEVKANGAKGGEIVMWSTQSSEHYGSLQAKNGGRIELSSKGNIRQTGALQAGPGGSVLFDPKNLIITDTPPDSLALARKVVSGSVNSGQPALSDGDNFGFSIALNGDRLAVGAPGDDTGGPDRGAVHLFSGVGTNFSGLTWQKKLASGTGAAGMAALSDTDHFGFSIALNGDRLAVGAIGDDTGGTDRGAVHLLTGVGSNFSGLTWRKKLTSGSGAAGMPALSDFDGFGFSVALDGDRLAVGAAFDDRGGSNRGAVYLYNGVGVDYAGLTHQRKLFSGAPGMPILADGDQFGSAIALDGDRMAVGAPLDDTGGIDRGAVHLFTNVGSDFSSLVYQKSLTSGAGATGVPALADGDFFGFAVALDSDRLAVGADRDHTVGTDRGAVHLFSGVGTAFSSLSWDKKLTSGAGAIGMPALADGDFFGRAVALDGDRLAVGALGDSTAGAGRGAVYLFTGLSSGTIGVGDATFAANPSGTSYITSASIEALLSVGTAVTLQANNDITVLSPIVVNEGGSGGNFTMRAGRNIGFSANITTDNGNFTAVAGDTGASAAFKDSGTPTITIDSGVTLNVGLGTATLAAVGGNFVNNNSNAAITNNADGGHWLIYAANPATTTEGFTSFNKHYNQGFILGSEPPSYAAGGGNWFLYSLAPTLSVTPSSHTITYGAATPGFTPSLTGFIDGDTAAGAGLSGTSIWNVGGSISSSGNSSAGAHDVSYSSGLLSSLGYQVADNAVSSNELTVNAKALTVSAFTALNKVYDGTTLASVSGGALSGLISGDVVNLTGWTGTFDTKNVGVNKTVTISSGSLIGADAGNYALGSTSGTTTADITPRSLTASYTGNNKVYDGTLAAGVTGSSTNIVAGDVVNFSQTATFTNKNVGTGKAINVSGIALIGADAGNYSLSGTSAATSANITAKNLGVGAFTAQDKVYDAKTAATVTGGLLSGVIAGDAVGLTGITGSFDNKNVGTNKTVTVSGGSLSGADAANYALGSTSGTTTADITPKTLTASAITALDKVYDGSVSATLSGGSLSGVISGDTVSLAGVSGSFDSKNVGTNKTVTIFGGALSGSDAGNYSLGATGSSTTADITPKNLTVSALTAQDKVYDGTTAATLNGGALSGAITGDAVSLSGVSGNFDTKKVGINKTVTISSGTLGGLDAGNYTLGSTGATTTADITAKSLTASGLAAADKVYDSTTIASVSGGTLSGVILGDAVNISGATGAFDNKNVGVNKSVIVTGVSLTGADAGNYTVASTTASTADITPATLTYVADPIQGITAPPSTGLTGKVTGFKGSDTLVTDTTGAPAWSTPAAPGSPRGSYSVEGSGLTASNYVFVQAPGNSTALTLLAPDTPDLPEQQARNNAISSIENTVRSIDSAQLTGDRSMRLLAVALGAPGNRISDLSDAPGFGSVDLSSMSRDQMTQLISLRREFKKKLFADAIYKLEVDPSLAEVPECANAAVADSGLCRLTDAQRREVVAKVAQANPANTALKIKVATLPDIQRKIVIAFGIDKYADQEIQPLDNAVLDAKAVSKAFAESLGYEVRVIENPTKADIIRTLNQLSTEIQKNDSLIIYYAGHGFKLDETGLGYWIPSDGSAEDPKNWISNADVSKMLVSIGANQVAVISDSCYSGAFTKEKKLEFTTQEVKPDEVLTKRSVVVMSSGGDEPVVDAGGKGGHSIFAAQLMETIQDVDKWQAGNDVFTVVQEAVHKKFPQQPQYGAAVSAGHQAGGDYLFEYRQLEAK